MSKGSTFGGPPAAAKAAANTSDDDELNLAELEEALGNPMHALPPVVRRRIDSLQNLHKQYLTLQKQYHAEVRELERKYQKLYDPVFDKRASVVSGAYEPTDAEAHVEKKEDEEEGVKKREAEPGDADIKGVPDFWLTVLQNNNLVAESIFEQDEEALTFLRDIRYAELDETEGFTLTFHFAENPFFSNTTLTKTYHMEQEELFGELQYDRATGCKVEWKAGKNLTVKQIKKKTKAKGKKPGRVVTVEEHRDSFFSFFAPPQPPASEDDEFDEEAANSMEMDFEIGCIIKDKLIPFSVLWFTGEAQEYDDEGDEDDMFDEDGEEDEDDNEDEDDDEDEMEEEAPKKGGKRQGPGHPFAAPPGAKPAPGQPQQPECKQQ